MKKQKIKNTTEYPLTRLKNDMTVVSHRMSGRDSIAFGVWFDVGSRYEARKIAGISHFIEHLVFKGTPRRSARKIKEEIEGRGGVLNAFTSEDMTCYFVKIVKKHFHLAVDVIADMVQAPLFNSRDIERERTVILEEIKMYMDMPMHYAHDLIHQLLWPNQPLGMFVAGDASSVSRITPREIKQYHAAYYRPCNAAVTFCGDSDHDEIHAAVAQRFSLQKKKDMRPCERANSTQSEPRFLFHEKDTEQSHIVLAMHGLKRTDPRRYALALLHIMLGANMSSRLYEEVREKRGLAYEIRSGISFYQDAGSFHISAGVENTKVENTMAVIMKELTKIRKNGIRKAELVRAKEYLISQLYFGFDDTLDHMLWLGDKVLSFKKIPDKKTITQNIAGITADDITALIKDLFSDENLNLVIIGPLNEKRQKQVRKVLCYL